MTRCPLCQSELQEVACVAVIPRGRHVQRKDTVAAACSGCEFMVDLRRSDGVRKSALQVLRSVARFLARHRRLLRDGIARASRQRV